MGLKEEDEEENEIGTQQNQGRRRSHHANYPSWKHKLRENCFKRVRQDRNQLLWNFRLRHQDHSPSTHKDNVKSTLQDIFSDELRKIKSDGCPPPFSHDMIWEYDGLHTAYQGDCEQILLEMQKIFYEDLIVEETAQETSLYSGIQQVIEHLPLISPLQLTRIWEQLEIESKSYRKIWEDEEDEYLARVVYEHMQLNSEKAGTEVWCPICKQGELQENGHHISCSQCELKLKTDDEVNLKFLQLRLGEAHDEHLDRGCRLRPEFCIETNFGLTALYIKCQGCTTFEVVL